MDPGTTSVDGPTVVGRVLFDLATQRTLAAQQGRDAPGGVAGLGDIVMVPPVIDARQRGVLHAEPMFARLTRDGSGWDDGRTRAVDAIIWCTGFEPDLHHLDPLQLSGSIAGGVAALGGSALAAFLLTTTVGGQISCADVGASASDSIKSVTGTVAESVNCTNAKVRDRGERIEISPVLTRVVMPGQVPRVTPGSCTITITYSNTGTVPLVAPWFHTDEIPAG